LKFAVNYVTQVHESIQSIEKTQWNTLLGTQSEPTPFMRHEYLNALETSLSATPETGWSSRFVALWDHDTLLAACPLYLKTHSYGEYVFDWAWAQAYERHGLSYYPKALIAVPFTPVPGSRLLAQSEELRRALLKAVLALCESWQVSSLHMLFASEDDQRASQDAGLMARQTVQFHWQNPNSPDVLSFEDFLMTLTQDKRKKIRQERNKVTQAGVIFKAIEGQDMKAEDWDFFYRCYSQTYYEHGNAPYLSREFFQSQASLMPENWLIFKAQQDGEDIACSLIGLERDPLTQEPQVAYGRYWGALKRVDCLHFEACYYQPLAWCIERKVKRFEGGAQGEHKMARALLPVSTHSAHWLAHPSFADAVENFLEREGAGVQHYLEHLKSRNPIKGKS
jgi:hypothetical protein